MPILGSERRLDCCTALGSKRPPERDRTGASASLVLPLARRSPLYGIRTVLLSILMTILGLASAGVQVTLVVLNGRPIEFGKEETPLGQLLFPACPHNWIAPPNGHPTTSMGDVAGCPSTGELAQSPRTTAAHWMSSITIFFEDNECAKCLSAAYCGARSSREVTRSEISDRHQHRAPFTPRPSRLCAPLPKAVPRTNSIQRVTGPV